LTSTLGNSSYPFLDLYLSGGVYLGGTGAANQLDDYEEGTFTPGIEGNSTAGTYETATATGTYTKVGRLVTVSFDITLDSVITGGGSGYAKFTGFPFNYSGAISVGAFGAPRVDGVNFNDTTVQLIFSRVASGTSNEFLITEVFDNANFQLVDISDFAAGDSVKHTFTYFAA